MGRTWARRFADTTSFRAQVGSTFLARTVALLLGVAQGAIVARWLGPDGKGVLALLLLVPAMLQLLFGLGLEPSVTYHVASRRLPVSQLTRLSMVVALGGGVAALTLVLFLHAFGALERLLPDLPVHLVLVAVGVVPLMTLSSALISILRGMERLHAVNIVRIIPPAVLVAGTGLALVVFGSDVIGVVVAWVAATVVGFAAALAAARKTGVSLRPSVQRESLRPVVSYGLRSHAGNAVQFFNYRLDLFVLNFIAGPAAVGVYSVSVRLGELLWELPNAVGFVIFPRAASRSREDMNRFTPRAFGWTLLMSAAGAVVLVAVGGPAIRLVYGSAFSSAYEPLLVLLPGIILLGAGKVLTNDIAGRGHPGYNAAISAVALAVTVGLDLVLIPRYGILGAAAASSSAYVLTFLLAVLIWKKVGTGRLEPAPPAVDLPVVP